VQLAQRGEAINVIAVADYANLVANGVLTNEQTIAEEPELVEGFRARLSARPARHAGRPRHGFRDEPALRRGLTDDRRGVLPTPAGCGGPSCLGRADPLPGRRHTICC
jgi:hypothetical protein